MTNEQIAATLEKLADLLEFQGTDAFRLRAYRNAARTIESLAEPLEELVQQNADLTSIKGIGKSVAQKCQELVQTGSLHQLDEILEEVPGSVLDLLRVPKLGPKKAAVLFQELQISDLNQLRAACESGRVRELPGFGEKTEAQILKGLDLAIRAGRRILWSQADDLVEDLRQHLADCDAVRQLEFAGSYRRGKDTVGDLDILIDSDDATAVMDCLATYSRLAEVTDRGPTKMSIRLEDGFQVDLRVVPSESFGAALQYFTGSKEHNVLVRSRAREKGLKVNEWGVFQLNAESDSPIAGRSESEVYQAIGLPCLPPEVREGRDEFAWAEAQDGIPRLIELADLRGDLHMHTHATDGSGSIDEMIAAARQRGLEYIAITDHSKRVTMARGLDADRVRRQWHLIDEINASLEGDFHVFKGIECDILEDGTMDLPDDVLADADWVLASVHYGQSQPRDQITRRILNAIENPYVSAIAHPTGRLLNRRDPYAVAMDEIIAAAAEHKKILELNANPSRLDLNDLHCEMARSAGVPIVINSDAHSPAGIDVLRYGVLQARRGRLSPESVLNTRSLAEMKQRLLG